MEIPEGGYDENDDCLNLEDEQYLAALEELDKKGKAKVQKYVGGEPVGSEDEDDIDYTSPLDTINIFQFFYQAMTAASHREPGLFAQLQSNLSHEDRGILNEIIVHARSRTGSLIFCAS